MLRIKIKQLREAANVSQAQLAKALGVSQSTVGMWESGKNMPQHSAMIKIAKYFGVGLDYLVGNEIGQNQPEDEELREYLEELKNRPDKRLVFNLMKNATKEDVEKAVKIIETLMNK